MTELNYAIQRLTAWVRDYGDKKEPVFIADVNTLLDVAKKQQAIEALVRSMNHLGVNTGAHGLAGKVLAILEGE